MDENEMLVRTDFNKERRHRRHHQQQQQRQQRLRGQHGEPQLHGFSGGQLELGPNSVYVLPYVLMRHDIELQTCLKMDPINRKWRLDSNQLSHLVMSEVSQQNLKTSRLAKMIGCSQALLRLLLCQESRNMSQNFLKDSLCSKEEMLYKLILWLSMPKCVRSRMVNEQSCKSRMPETQALVKAVVKEMLDADISFNELVSIVDASITSLEERLILIVNAIETPFPTLFAPRPVYESLWHWLRQPLRIRLKSISTEHNKSHIDSFSLCSLFNAELASRSYSLRQLSSYLGSTSNKLGAVLANPLDYGQATLTQRKLYFNLSQLANLSDFERRETLNKSSNTNFINENNRMHEKGLEPSLSLKSIAQQLLTEVSELQLYSMAQLATVSRVPTSRLVSLLTERSKSDCSLLTKKERNDLRRLSMLLDWDSKARQAFILFECSSNNRRREEESKKNGSDVAKRKVGQRFGAEQTKVLIEKFAENNRPDLRTRSELAQTLGLPLKSVSLFFSNRRNRLANKERNRVKEETRDNNGNGDKNLEENKMATLLES